LLGQGRIPEAICRLKEAHREDHYIYHTDIVRELALKLLEMGMESRNPDDMIRALYGIGLASCEEALVFIPRALHSDIFEVELAATELLASINSDTSNRLLEEALASDFLLVRVEALSAIASRQLPRAAAHIEALFSKVEPEYRHFFPEFFALARSPDAREILKKLTYDSDPEVRLEAISALATFSDDDTLNLMKNLSLDPSEEIREAAAVALAAHPDEDSKSICERVFARKNYAALVLARSLSHDEFIEEEARADNLFAISALSSCPAGAELLYEKCTSPDLGVRINAACALLERQDRAAAAALMPFFIQGPNDLLFTKIASPAKALFAYKAIPSASEHFRQMPFLFELSLRLRQELLAKTVELPHDAFLNIARAIFSHQQKELVPLLVRLLENERSEEAILLLRAESERLGSPLIRAYCQLALFRLNEEGPYEKNLFEWIEKNRGNELEVRPLLPRKVRSDKSPYTLTLEERSELLVEAFEALAESKKEEALSALLDAIAKGSPHNRCLLAGLLLRAVD
jgi:HEAT repeat protein